MYKVYAATHLSVSAGESFEHKVELDNFTWK